MDKIQEKIKTLGDVEFPPGLRGRIMRKLLFLQFRTPFLIIVSLLLLNLIVGSSRLWVAISDNQAYQVIKTFLGDFEFSREYFLTFYQVMGSLIPLSLIISLFLNTLLIFYVFYLSFSFKKVNKGRVLGIHD